MREERKEPLAGNVWRSTNRGRARSVGQNFLSSMELQFPPHATASGIIRWIMSSRYRYRWLDRQIVLIHDNSWLFSFKRLSAFSNPDRRSADSDASDSVYYATVNVDCTSCWVITRTWYLPVYRARASFGFVYTHRDLALSDK